MIAAMKRIINAIATTSSDLALLALVLAGAWGGI